MERALKILVTNRCNSKCLMCNIWKSPQKTDIDINKLIESIDIKITGVSISGGEPTLFKPLSELIEAVPSDKVLLNTNGTNSNIVIDIVKTTTKRLTVGVSLDGMNELHNFQRGINCYDSAIDLINRLKSNNINTVISYTITPQNISDMMKVYALSQELGCGFSTRPAHSNDYYKQNTYFNENAIYLLKEELKKMEAIWNEGYFGTYFTYHIPDYLEGKIRSPKCKEMNRSMWIDESGNVFPCPTFKHLIVGNIYKNTVSEIVDSDNYKNVLNDLDACRSCWNDCAVIGNLAQSYNGFLKYPFALTKLLKKV